MANFLVAAGFALVVLVVVLPIIGFVAFSFLDVLAREDIGSWSKIFWLMMLMGVPGLGLLVYWLFRPKTWDTWGPVSHRFP